MFSYTYAKRVLYPSGDIRPIRIDFERKRERTIRGHWIAEIIRMMYSNPQVAEASMDDVLDQKFASDFIDTELAAMGDYLSYRSVEQSCLSKTKEVFRIDYSAEMY